MQYKNVRFTGVDTTEFYKVLRSRVNSYFRENNISRHANTNMVVKTIFMLTLYLFPFSMLFFVDYSPWLFIALWSITGIGMAGVGLSVMHDANHGAYSKNELVNKIVGKVMVLLGGSDVNWRIQHNVLHHTYTNVADMDEDIKPPSFILRFSPHTKRNKLHRFQFIYAWFFYGLMTMMWSTTKDFQQAVRYKKKGLIQTQKISFSRHLTNLIVSKIVYMSLFLALPILLIDAPWYMSLLGWATMQFICGFILAAIFQPAHVVPSSDYLKPDESGNVDADWAINQLYNTANFAPSDSILTWYIGGLNYQVEHHLFPNICHVHYPKLSKIVRETANEFNLPYHSYNSFLGALLGHSKMLYNLGKFDNAPAIH
ncbi:MAG: acyl-CoA desaturase [Bacteroidetes bacterium]|nr:acyl-CoA desaturase [Bacteroidota bacterium]